MIVVDAAALADALVDDGPAGEAARDALLTDDLIDRMWELRAKVSAYEAAYVAAAGASTARW